MTGDLVTELERLAPPKAPLAAFGGDMHLARFLIVLLAIASIFCNAAHATPPKQLVLFVGNSLTYVGNTPAVFDALSASNGRTVQSDMIVEGGATLSQRLNDGSVARAFASRRYDAVVLQERGGDLMCSFGPASCEESRSAIKSLTSLAVKSGAKVYLMGSYQGDPAASRALVAAETAAAAGAGIPYLEVSLKLQVLRAATNRVEWMASDGMHPGPGLALLNAAVLYRALTGTSPAPSAFTVNAPIYGTTSGLTASLRRATDAPPLPNTPRSASYPADWVHTVVEALPASSGD